MSSEETVIVPSAPQGLLPIPTTRVYRAKDGRVSEKLRYDITGYGLNEVRKFMVAIVTDNIGEQNSIENPPAFAEVDGVRGKGIAFAQRRVTVSFGMRLKVAALNSLQTALRTAIDTSTEAKTGTLSSMANWQFRYVRNGSVTPLPLGGASGIPMGPNDFIILAPVGVINQKGQNYGTAVNMRVAGSGKLSFRRSARGRVSRKNQSLGFLALAARAAGSSSAFDGFNVTAKFTTRYHQPGEVVHIGGGPRTGYLKISPKTGRR